MKALRKPGRLALIVCLTFALVGAVSGVTFSAFTSKADNPGNLVKAAPDWKGPTVTGGVGRLNGPLGAFKQGDTVYLYANVTDTGNPASGVASVSADVTVPGYGSISLPLTAGSYSVGGQTYNYRSSGQQTPYPFAEQTLTVTVVATDNAGNTTNQNIFVDVDNTAPGVGPAGVTTTNGGGTQSRIEQNDTIAFNFSEAMDPDSILSGWSGSAQNITVRLNNNAAGGNDQLTFYNQANNTQLALGSVNLGRSDYTSNSRTFNNSSMVMSGNRITVTFGSASGSVTTAGGTAQMIWTTPTGATDLAGNGMSGANWNEPGPTDRDF